MVNTSTIPTEVENVLALFLTATWLTSHPHVSREYHIHPDIPQDVYSYPHVCEEYFLQHKRDHNRHNHPRLHEELYIINYCIQAAGPTIPTEVENILALFLTATWLTNYPYARREYYLQAVFRCFRFQSFPCMWEWFERVITLIGWVQLSLFT